jgi:hypothetical protein
MSLKTVAVATSTFACATLLSFGWSDQSGVSLSVESAQARIGRPLTPLSVAGVARRQNRRAGYGYGAGVVGAGVAGAAAVGTAAAIAATPGWGWGGGPYYAGTGYYGGGPLGARAAYYPAASGMGMWAPITQANWEQYLKNLHDAGYDPKNDYGSNGVIRDHLP